MAATHPAPLDYLDVIDAFLPGVVPSRDLVDALSAAHGAGTAMTEANVLAINGPLPVEDTGLPRFADSNPAPRDGWTTYGRLS